MADNQDKSAANAQPSAASTTVVAAIDDLAARCVWPHQAAALRWLREDFVRLMLAQLPHLAAGKWHLRLAGAAVGKKMQFVSSVEEKTCCYGLTMSPPDGPGAEALAADVCHPQASSWLGGARQTQAHPQAEKIPLEGGTKPEPTETPTTLPAAPIAAGWIETTPSIAFPILNCLLGGSSDDQFIPRRPLTAIERRLLLRLTELAADALVRSWPAKPAAAWCVNPEAVLAPSEGDATQTVLTASFDFGLDRQAGTLRLSLDHTLVPPLSSPWSPPTQKDSVLEITAVLAESDISPQELADLKPGDILTSSVPVDGEVIIRVAGIPKFVGQLGTCNGRRAVTIVRRIS